MCLWVELSLSAPLPPAAAAAAVAAAAAAYCHVAQDVLASSTACAEEALVASKVVRTFGTEQKEQDRYLGWLE
jgi:hypothetical protein